MGHRLLLADDSITIQKVVAIIFANEEYELTVVDNGIAALEKAREIRPDVMLVDALMPGKTGYEVCAEIRRDPQLCAVPILLLIGAFENPDEEEARSCGADSSISKPFESQQLIDRVKEMLELGKDRSVAPPVRPLPLESAAEELWGDLSAFDVMPPVAVTAAPAATPPPAPAAQASEPAVPTKPAREPVAPAYSAPVSAPAPSSPGAASEPFRAAPAVLEEDIIEAGYEDDLWGAFEMDEEPKVPAAAPPVGAGLEPEEELEAEEFFSFEDESEAIEETGPALGAVGAIEALVDEPVVLPSDEDLFAFSDDLSFKSPPQGEPFLLQEYEPFSFEPEPESEPAPAAAPGLEPPPALAAEPAPDPEFELEAELELELGLAPVEPEPYEPALFDPFAEPAPILEPQSAPIFQQQPTVAGVAQQQPGVAALNESELVAAISKISREVIERIVWEVVPDLAEALIKEEIRKLKAGIRG